MLQSAVANFYRRSPNLQYDRELVPMTDGECCALDWYQPQGLAPTTATVLVLHGLAGNSYEVNVQILVQLIRRSGLRVCVWNRRGCALNLKLQVGLCCAVLRAARCCVVLTCADRVCVRGAESPAVHIRRHSRPALHSA